jgi:glycosyltransferase involved in cell wall biosynthesis
MINRQAGIGGRMKGLKIGIIIGTYPDFSTTFIDREVRMMRHRGLNVVLLSIRQPPLLRALSQEQRLYQQDVTYLIPVRWIPFIVGQVSFLITHFRTYFQILFYLASRPHPTARDWMMTILHFAEGVYAAHRLRKHAPTHIHAHFVDRAATVAMVASRFLNVPYSLAIHAGEDIYVHPVLLQEKLTNAEFLVSCTRYNLNFLAQSCFSFPGHKAFCVYHGLDIQEYKPGTRKQEPPLVLSVGRLVEKKGLEYLVKACRILWDKGESFVCHIIGAGIEDRKLESLIRQFSLQDSVKLLGAVPHEEVIKEYERATIFALPCVQGTDGSLDGIPNVLLEAMAMKLPVVSTAISAIPELIQDGVDGLLVASKDETALAKAIVRLLHNQALRVNLGERAREKVSVRFNIHRNTEALFSLFLNLGRPYAES